MNALLAFGRQLVGLVVDDGSLALAIVVIVAFAGLLALLLPDDRLVAGAVLLGGCLAALSANVMLATRR
jgi:hypothetical protein